ncbi:UNVERIFIED_ORG: antibiotic biosynthesis monooxygenase (ABM) superfamily enzyme [Rhizobium etli]
MIIRYALFEGEIHPGREEEFRAFVRERLVPLWTKFPGAEEVRVLDGMERDDGAPVYAMALAIRYPDMDAVNAALRSDVRFESREVTGELLRLFTGKVHHHVFAANEYPPRVA